MFRVGTGSCRSSRCLRRAREEVHTRGSGGSDLQHRRGSNREFPTRAGSLACHASLAFASRARRASAPGRDTAHPMKHIAIIVFVLSAGSYSASVLPASALSGNAIPASTLVQDSTHEVCKKHVEAARQLFRSGTLSVGPEAKIPPAVVGYIQGVRELEATERVREYLVGVFARGYCMVTIHTMMRDQSNSER